MLEAVLKGKWNGITIPRTPLEQAAYIVLVAVQGAAPVAKPTPRMKGTPGYLRDNLQVRASGRNECMIFGPDFARYVIEGTRPHAIHPRRDSSAMALAFFWPRVQGMAFFAQVMHPGTKPNDFRQQGLHDATGRLDDLVRVWSQGITV